MGAGVVCFILWPLFCLPVESLYLVFESTTPGKELLLMLSMRSWCYCDLSMAITWLLNWMIKNSICYRKEKGCHQQLHENIAGILDFFEGGITARYLGTFLDVNIWYTETNSAIQFCMVCTATSNIDDCKSCDHWHASYFLEQHPQKQTYEWKSTTKSYKSVEKLLYRFMRLTILTTNHS